MLICSRPPPANWAVTDLEAYDSQEVAPIKTTLLIAPATLLAQWEDEIKAHLVPGALRYGRLEPNPQKFDAGVNTRRVATHRKKTVPPRCKLPDGDTAPLHTLDLALLSYEHLRDHSRGDSLNLEHFGFWRVCLDEAQMISNTNSVAALMASSLWRRHAWVITGTPITSKLDEIQGLLTFLTLEPMDAMRYWRSLVGHECDQFSAAGLLALRGLLRGVMLRRSKAQVCKLKRNSACFAYFSSFCQDSVDDVQNFVLNVCLPALLQLLS